MAERTSASDAAASRSAVLVRVAGLVQGVGFRPTVYRVAAALNLKGRVFNDAAGVGIHLEGDPAAIDAFPNALLKAKPPLARIDSIDATPADFEGLECFAIAASQSGGKIATAVTADAATCRACFADMFERGGRRWRYAFTNCTHCGPRFTITRRLPYDRPQTAMAPFSMCPACRKEYEDPLDRRFHAQPNACPVCGPQLSVFDAKGNALEGDPVQVAVRAIREGKILALKGIGGFHLVCDARNPEAVKLLKKRKRRDEKPLAVMTANLASARAFLEVNEKEAELLSSPAHPIVLAKKRRDVEERLEGVADQLSEIGVMLPYSPLHALLFHEWAGEPEGVVWLENEAIDACFVMTSANPSGEPLVIANDEAFAALKDIADIFLTHNRDILIRCDDSVARIVDGKPVWVRRARGAVPEAVKLAALPGEEKPANVLALGPHLKNTAALLKADEAFLTQHVGDLDNASTCEALLLAVKHLESILETTPEAYACDAHPDFFSTRLAQELAEASGKPCLRIPHHAAHVGVLMAEAKRTAPTLGLALDGVGLGPDGEVWGGELLWVGPSSFMRLGHLLPLAIPGGDRAAREPWRMGSAILHALGKDDAVKAFFGHIPMSASISALIDSPVTRKSSALGRLFDGAAALLLLADHQHDEATAAMRLEALASDAVFLKFDDGDDAFDGLVMKRGWTIEDGVLSLLPFLDRLTDAMTESGLSREAGSLARTKPLRALWAARFQATLAAAVAQWTAEARNRLSEEKRAQLDDIAALTGGCMLNRVLARELPERLAEKGLRGLIPHIVPPGDGGLSLGEAWLARLALHARKEAHDYEGELFARRSA